MHLRVGQSKREMLQHHIRICLDDPARPEVRALVSQLDSYQASLYPAESNHLVPVESLRQANVTFLTARVDEKLVGCGALINHGGEYAELKRMFVLPEFRGL